MKRLIALLAVSYQVAHGQYATDTYTATPQEVADGLNQTKPLTPYNLAQSGLLNIIGGGWIPSNLQSNNINNALTNNQSTPVNLSNTLNLASSGNVANPLIFPNGRINTGGRIYLTNGAFISIGSVPNNYLFAEYGIHDSTGTYLPAFSTIATNGSGLSVFVNDLGLATNGQGNSVFVNDSGFLTTIAGLNNSQLNNDAGFATSAYVNTVSNQTVLAASNAVAVWDNNEDRQYAQKTNSTIYGGIVVLSTNAGNFVILSNYQAGSECDLVVGVAGIGTNSFQFFSTGNANFKGTLTANGYNVQNGTNFSVGSTGNGTIGGFSFTNGSSSFYSGTTKLTTLTGTSPLGVGQGYNILTDGAGASGGWKTRLDGGFHIANNSNPQVGNDFCNYGSNAIVGGSITATNGFSSLASNTLALASITFPASAANWTNTFGKTIFVFIDNLGVTGTVVKINGTQVFSGLANDITLPLQSGEYFSETYTVGTPTATWKPF